MGRTHDVRHPAPPPGLTITGTYNWVVTYSGDTNNNGVAVSNFGNESVRPPGQP